ncbi:hypothetical protein G9A89_022991 [Geosiphon pyriformis]|nr:hypothetical protein G9A89_022991 [Geosiphon pyriformis]
MTTPAGKRNSPSGSNELAPKDKKLKTIACDRCRRRKVRCEGDGYAQTPCAYCTSVQLECTYNQNTRNSNRNVNSRNQPSSSSSAHSRSHSNIDTQSLLRSSGTAGKKSSISTASQSGRKGSSSIIKRQSSPKLKIPSVSTSTLGISTLNSQETPPLKRRVPKILPNVDSKKGEFDYAVGLLTSMTNQQEGIILQELSPYIIPPKEETRQPPSGSVETQSSQLTQSLVSLYFRNFHIIFPVLHRAYFLQRLGDPTKPMNDLLLSAVCAIGSKFSDDPVVRKNPNDPTTVGQRFYEQAQGLITKNFDIPRLSTATGCFLLGVFDALRSLKSRMYVGMATTLAVTMRLHDKSASEGFSEMEKEARNKLWWAINIVNHLQCVSLNQLSVFEDKHSTIELTTKSDSALDADDNEMKITAYFLSYFKITKIMYDILEFTLGTENGSDIAMKRLEDRLNKWKNDLPSFLQLDNIRTFEIASQETTIEHLRIYQCILYHYTTIRIHHPNIHFERSKSICNEAANRIAEFLNEHLVSIISSNQFIAHCALYAGYVHIQNLREEAKESELYRNAKEKTLQTMRWFQLLEAVPSLHFISSDIRNWIAIFASQLRSHLDDNDEHTINIVNAALALVSHRMINPSSTNKDVIDIGSSSVIDPDTTGRATTGTRNVSRFTELQSGDSYRGKNSQLDIGNSRKGRMSSDQTSPPGIDLLAQAAAQQNSPEINVPGNTGISESWLQSNPHHKEQADPIFTSSPTLLLPINRPVPMQHNFHDSNSDTTDISNNSSAPAYQMPMYQEQSNRDQQQYQTQQHSSQQNHRQNDMSFDASSTSNNPTSGSGVSFHTPWPPGYHFSWPPAQPSQTNHHSSNQLTNPPHGNDTMMMPFLSSTSNSSSDINTRAAQAPISTQTSLPRLISPTSSNFSFHPSAGTMVLPYPQYPPLQQPQQPYSTIQAQKQFYLPKTPPKSVTNLSLNIGMNFGHGTYLNSGEMVNSGSDLRNNMTRMTGIVTDMPGINTLNSDSHAPGMISPISPVTSPTEGSLMIDHSSDEDIIERHHEQHQHQHHQNQHHQNQHQEQHSSQPHSNHSPTSQNHPQHWGWGNNFES